MFTLFPAQTDDLLDRQALPKTAFHTELNYRTKPLTDSQERRIVWLLFFVVLPTICGLGALHHFFCWLFPLIRHVTISGGLLLSGWLGLRMLTGALQKTEQFIGFGYFVICLCSLMWEFCLTDNLSSMWSALILSWMGSSLITRQVAAWHLAAPTVDYERGQRWKVNLPQLIPHGLSLDCPELLSYTVSPLLLSVSWVLSLWLLVYFQFGISYWLVSYVVSLILIWGAWHLLASPILPLPSLSSSLKATWQALLVFITYDIYYTPAAGVFRFPTTCLRSPWHRNGLLILVLIVIGFGFGTKLPNPFEVYQTGGSFSVQLLTNWGLISLAGPLVCFSTLWFCAGTLLARFEQELSKSEGTGHSEWDNYVDRMFNSADELEREHLLIGTTEQGDYPVLLHRDIHDQHGHILGDSGASKTALAMAPQATQLIARADSTVVIIDLKGDKALFESCRREAARTRKLPFRWISNEAGKTSFGFNPFLQSHNQRLSIEQFSQQLLRGLSLDYGLDYGPSYFTAMNEIVLNNVLRETNARSFAELSQHLEDRKWYKNIGHEDDWKQARHLIALVKRLAASQAVNVVPEMYVETPDVQQNVIDVSNLYEEPQVVYLWLRSAVEPTNAPAIARLFLWSMFTASSHQPQDDHRVYFFIDEMQQVISEGIKLIFEQFRDLGGTIIAAHQTASQLRQNGTNLGDTIDSCTAFKQILRASDLTSLERLEKLSGTKRENVAMWQQVYERGSGDLFDRYHEIHAEEELVRVSTKEQPRFSYDALQAMSSRRQSSLVRFTFGSGYTQFGGKSVLLNSQYHISYDEYLNRRQHPWPTHPGAFEIESPTQHQPVAAKAQHETMTKREQEFLNEFEQRGESFFH